MNLASIHISDYVAEQRRKIPTVDAVPLSELIELRDRLITRGGLRELNMLIDKYEGERKDGNNGTA